MTPEKAIELLTEDTQHPTAQFMPDLREAERLGIEALKFRQRWEQQEGEPDFPLLPGETKE